MKRERSNKFTRAEWAQITSSRAVVRRVIRKETPCKAGYPMQGGEVPPFGPGLTSKTKASEGEQP